MNLINLTKLSIKFMNMILSTVISIKKMDIN